jgi:hypothetical protein
LTATYVELNKLDEVKPTVTAKQGKGFETNPGETNDWQKPTKGMKERLNEYEKGA